MPHNLEYANEFFSFLTGKATAAMGRRLQKNLKEQGVLITAEQWSLLYYLWIEEGRTQQELAALTFRDKPCVSRLIDNLEKMNLVMRVIDKDDKRSNLIFLTKTGRQLRETGLQQAKKTIGEALDGLDHQDMIRAKDTLELLYANLK